uniref:Uncharacterized protein n=1 Tax=Sphaerodactylus townsendi TaxID=933632 RepID=A0ACB8FH26_9SAUR
MIQNKATILEKRLTKQEFWQLVQQSYGSEVGLNTEEMENVYSSSEENGRSRSSLCDEFGEKDEKLSKAFGVVQEPVDQILETESLNGTQLPEDAEPEESHCDKPERRSSLLSSERMPVDLAQHKNSMQLPDLNETFPPEKISASESEGEAEDTILDHDLHGKIFINLVLRIGADKMFEMLFTNSHFMQRYFMTRNITDTVSTPWNRDAGGNQLRTMTYTLILNSPLIGKSTAVTEKQVLHKQSHKGHLYRIDAEVFTHDVPYHDYFYTVYTYCITHMSSERCRLRISSDVKYKKQPWGLVKSIIEKNTWGGIQENFKQLGPKKDAKNKTIAIIVIMSIFLLLLVMLNVTLFVKLSKIENAAQSFYQVHLQEEGSVNLALNMASRGKNPQHDTGKAQHVKGVLRDSIALLEQVKKEA